MKRIGWVGFVNDKPYFENTTDDYSTNGSESTPVVDVYKKKKEAKKRFQDIREVFVKEKK
jgi:hypothetical protein